MTNNNLYVSLEELEKLVEKYSYSVVMNLWLRNEIKSLPTIDLWKIDEMIEFRILNTRATEKTHEDIIHNADMRYEINLLEWLKSRLFPKQ